MKNADADSDVTVTFFNERPAIRKVVEKLVNERDGYPHLSLLDGIVVETPNAVGGAVLSITAPRKEILAFLSLLNDDFGESYYTKKCFTYLYQDISMYKNIMRFVAR